jgi:hypothetical protein
VTLVLILVLVLGVVLAGLGYDASQATELLLGGGLVGLELARRLGVLDVPALRQFSL